MHAIQYSVHSIHVGRLKRLENKTRERGVFFFDALALDCDCIGLANLFHTFIKERIIQYIKMNPYQTMHWNIFARCIIEKEGTSKRLPIQYNKENGNCPRTNNNRTRSFLLHVTILKRKSFICAMVAWILFVQPLLLSIPTDRVGSFVTKKADYFQRTTSVIVSYAIVLLKKYTAFFQAWTKPVTS